MKLTNLIWVLAMAAMIAACNSGAPVTGCKITEVPNPVTGRCEPLGGGTGGSDGNGTCDPGGGEGACINPADAEAYMNLEYTNETGDTFTGADAASEIGSDCIFGTETSDPVLPGCGDQAAAVLTCFTLGCPDQIIQELATCVAQCTQDATGLSTECMACTGETVACGAAFCTGQCREDTNAQICIDCRCANNCIQEFDTCSGLPSDCECD